MAANKQEYTIGRRPSLRTIAITLTCLLLPLTMLAGVLAGAIYKSANPDGIDITTSIAYLRQTMTVAIVTFVAITMTITGLVIAVYRRDHNFTQAKLPLVLLISTIAVVIALLLANAYTNSVQDQYLKDHGRPTLDQFFDALEKQR